MATDPVAVALARAAAEFRESGRLSAGTQSLLLQLTGREPAPEAPRSGPHHARLADRDDCIRELAALVPGLTWARAGIVAAWLRRWCAGDPLQDAPPAAADLCRQIGRALSHHQCYRVIAGDRSR